MLIDLADESKYFLESLGNGGLNKLLAPYEDKSADAVCTFAFSLEPTSEPLIFQGRLQVSASIPGGFNLKDPLTAITGQDCCCERAAGIRYVLEKHLFDHCGHRNSPVDRMGTNL